MPHVLRDTDAGLFHIWTHCVWAIPAHFKDDVDRLTFLRILATVTSNGHWQCICFCLMRSHFHLIVGVRDHALPAAMHRLNLAYSRTHNRRHKLKGHAQHRRYGSRRIVDDADLLGTFKYVVRNPVSAGLCKRPEDWPWSSYAGTIGIAEPYSFIDAGPLLACFERSELEPRAALRAHVDVEDEISDEAVTLQRE